MRSTPRWKSYVTSRGLHGGILAQSRANSGLWSAGLIACAAIIFDIADHLLATHFGRYSSTYEESLAGLRTRHAISEILSEQLQGLGGFRNILVHRDLQIDTKLSATCGFGTAAAPSIRTRYATIA